MEIALERTESASEYSYRNTLPYRYELAAYSNRKRVLIAAYESSDGLTLCTGSDEWLKSRHDIPGLWEIAAALQHYQNQLLGFFGWDAKSDKWIELATDEYEYDPVVDSALWGRALLWGFQLELLFGMCGDATLSPTELRRSINKKDARVWERSEQLYLPHGKPLSKVMAERGQGSFPSPDLKGAYLLSGLLGSAYTTN